MFVVVVDKQWRHEKKVKREKEQRAMEDDSDSDEECSSQSDDDVSPKEDKEPDDGGSIQATKDAFRLIKARLYKELNSDAKRPAALLSPIPMDTTATTVPRASASHKTSSDIKARAVTREEKKAMELLGMQVECSPIEALCSLVKVNSFFGVLRSVYVCVGQRKEEEAMEGVADAACVGVQRRHHRTFGAPVSLWTNGRAATYRLDQGGGVAAKLAEANVAAIPGVRVDHSRGPSRAQRAVSAASRCP